MKVQLHFALLKVYKYSISHQLKKISHYFVVIFPVYDHQNFIEFI